ncbi:MAG: non-lysosomal glucosylceramidase [Fimbriimonadaceae bacterium]|nr:non-lysosomal glucosylceramidase [Fimbriimonadaceae bacterium]
MAEITRRTMLKAAGSAAVGLGWAGRVLAVMEDGSIVVQQSRIPEQKNLSAAWRNSLVERGTKEVWSGPDLESIGMPVGGIAAGQLYLCGDGTLGWWEIFNHHTFFGYGLTSYAKRAIPKPVKFGFRIECAGRSWSLDKDGFSNVAFRGEHPIGTVTYQGDCPLEATVTAYSPFIPLNAKDSALPATVFEIELANRGASPVQATLGGFLENAVAASAKEDPGQRKRSTTRVEEPGLAMMVHRADPAKQTLGEPPAAVRKPVLIADFEGPDYGDWTVEGDAFGKGPARGTLADQNPVTGFVGSGLVNSFYKGDGTTGRLLSPEFVLDRRFLNFKIGGGNFPGETCVNLLVDGKLVRTAAGRNSEKLLWETWDLGDLEGKRARIEIVDKATGGWGHINADHFELADSIQSLEDLKVRNGDANRDHGTLALALLATGTAPSASSYGFEEPYIGEVATESFTVAPGASKTFRFVLAWHFPNHPNGRQYANWFEDAAAVARYVDHQFDRLSADTKRWRDTYYDSTLPYWLLDRLHSTLGNLATGTTEWWGNGRFWAWEGVVCCSGTCTHVWNYEHGLARLFPEIERNIRTRQDFGAGFDEATGLVGFRSDKAYAADGQCGTILKAYREHLTGADSGFLRENYPRIKKALEFLIKHDGNDDGVLEDSQPNTYDIDFYGPNTFVGSLYLGALRAGEEMAREVGDPTFAAKCRTLFEKGSAETVKRLWNGEYFAQVVDEKQHAKYQYGPGCLSDHLFGQGWAHQVGLGALYPPEMVKKALQSVWKYNWAPDVGPYNSLWKPERPYAVPGEAGLFICTWPKGGRQGEPVRYRDEVWTGIEYQVAGHMIWEGMVEEGLAICKAVHERYHPAKRNPYNEVECSDHYARALASWGVFTALAGFEYHGPRGVLGFAPRVSPEKFRCAFTGAEGWGSLEQRIEGGRHTARVELTWGRLGLSELQLQSKAQGEAKASVGGKAVPCTTTRDGERLVVHFAPALALVEGQTLEVTL